MSGTGVTRPNLHFFQYIQAYKPFADLVPPNIKQYQLILTKYQPLSSYTDPVPSSVTCNSSSWRHSSANWIISFFSTHLMSHAQYTWSSYCYFQPTLKHTSKKIKFPKLLKWKNLSLKIHVCCSSINQSSMSTQLLVLQLLLSSSLLKISIVPPGITNSSAFLFSSVQYIGFSAHHIAATVSNLLRLSLSSFSNS